MVAAKELPAETVSALDIEAPKKSLRRRRDSKEQHDVKIKHDIDDLVAIATYLDENKLTEQIPMFVAAEPDLIPSARLGDGDILAILNQVGIIHEQHAGRAGVDQRSRLTLKRSMATGVPVRGGGQNKGAGNKLSLTATFEASVHGALGGRSSGACRLLRT